MNEILEKISSYNLFNYLMPGVLFLVIVESSTNYSLMNDNIVLTAFIAYFVGLIISRVGSLVVEKVLRKTNFLKFKSYKDFVAASQKDPKLEVLSEQNNSYRTIIAMLIMAGVTKAYGWLASKVVFFDEWKLGIVSTLILIMFLFAYKKQTKYISDRIEKNLNQ